MSKNATVSSQRLGAVLQQAGLVSARQVEIALREQRHFKLRIGEIFALRGWLKQESADFFAEEWPRIRQQYPQRPIGQYLKQAGLLDEAQIRSILDAQRQTQLKFGALAIANGWVQRRTLNFFLKHLEQHRNSHVSGGETQPLEHPYDAIRLKLFNLTEHAEHPYQLLAAVLDWTGNQPELTQKLCQKIQASDLFIPAGEESAQVATLAQTQIVNDWESGIAAQHLRKMCDRICGHSLKHLQLYERIVKRHKIPAAGSAEERDLLLLGLIANKGDTLTVANRIYRLVFSHRWVTAEIARRAALADQLPSSQPESQTKQNPAARAPSAAEAVSYLLDVELDPLPLTIDVSAVDVPAEVTSEQGRQPVAAERIPSSAKTRLVLPWLALCAIGGTAIAIGTQLWRPNPQPSPVASSSPSPDTRVLPDAQPQPESVDPTPDVPASPSPQPEQPAADSEIAATVDRATPDRLRQAANPVEAPEASPASVISTSDPSVKVPIFVTGSTQRQLLEALGPPTQNWRGYYPDSKALVYKGIVPGRIDLGYLVSKTTGELRQTEIAFAQSIALETIQRTLRRLLGGELPNAVQDQLQQVYRRQADQHFFLLGTQEGEIHRDKNGWIYIGIWDADFH